MRLGEILMWQETMQQWQQMDSPSSPCATLFQNYLAIQYTVVKCREGLKVSKLESLPAFVKTQLLASVMLCMRDRWMVGPRMIHNPPTPPSLQETHWGWRRGSLLATFIELDSHLFKIRFELRYVAGYGGYLANGVLHLQSTVLWRLHSLNGGL